MSDIKKFANGVKRKASPNPTNWQYAALTLTKKTTKEKLPAKVSIKGKFPKPFDQIYNNCTSNAVLGCDAYYYHPGVDSNWVPSTVFTYYNQRKMEGCLNDPDDGSSVEVALDAVRKYGACNSKVWPNNKPYNAKPSPAAYKDGLKGHEVTKYYAVKTLLQIKKALATGYPIAASFSWPKFTYGDGYILTDSTKAEANNCECGHAIVLVGYDDAKRLVEFRNSWGDTWANNGYCYMTYTNLQNCIWWDDSYAIIK